MTAADFATLPAGTTVFTTGLDGYCYPKVVSAKFKKLHDDGRVVTENRGVTVIGGTPEHWFRSRIEAAGEVAARTDRMVAAKAANEATRRANEAAAAAERLDRMNAVAADEAAKAGAVTNGDVERTAFSISRATRCGAKVFAGGRVIGEIHHWTAAGASVRLADTERMAFAVIPACGGALASVRVSHVEITDEDFTAGRFGYEALSR